MPCSSRPGVQQRGAGLRDPDRSNHQCPHHQPHRCGHLAMASGGAGRRLCSRPSRPPPTGRRPLPPGPARRGLFEASHGSSNPIPASASAIQSQSTGGAPDATASGPELERDRQAQRDRRASYGNGRFIRPARRRTGPAAADRPGSSSCARPHHDGHQQGGEQQPVGGGADRPSAGNRAWQTRCRRRVRSASGSGPQRGTWGKVNSGFQQR